MDDALYQAPIDSGNKDQPCNIIMARDDQRKNNATYKKIIGCLPYQGRGECHHQELLRDCRGTGSKVLKRSVEQN